MEHVVVFITAPSMEEGKKIARKVVEEKLAACANIVPALHSIYWWQGKIETADEVMLIVKTKSSMVTRLVDRVKKLHSYTVPEIVALPIMDGNRDYLKWIDDSLKILH